MQNHRKISVALSIGYSLFGYIASVVSNGMKGPDGPVIAAIFIFTLLILDVVLIKRDFRLSRVNFINMASVLPFYFFSITLPLVSTCPSILPPIIAFIAFSVVTLLPFAVIARLIGRVLTKITV